MAMRAFGFLSILPFLLLFHLLIAAVVAANEPKPNVKRTQLPHQPLPPLYFDDSETILVTDDQGGYGSLWISTDGGGSWKLVPELEQQRVAKVYMNPHNNRMAIAAGVDKTHWITKDRGVTWKSFVTKYDPNFMAPPFSFHALDSNRIIMNMRDFDVFEAGERTLYTTDGFETTPKVLREKTIRCMWAQEQAQFTIASNAAKDRALCIIPGRYSTKQDDWRLVMSDTFFSTESDESEPDLEDGRPVQGIASMVAVKGYILAARTSEGTDEMALYVTKDTQEWYRAQFGQHKLKEGGYTIMESTNYSLQVDVTAPESASTGILYTSNSAGQYFTQSEEHTNRNNYGFVDFEKVSSIQGIVITNIVDNWAAVRDSGALKRLHSKISFDDGRTFEDIKAGGETLHLHSVTDQRNVGRVFSSPAPGLLMGIGNTGDSLLTYHEGHLYISEDAGATWRLGLKGAHKYEFGDSGSVFLAIFDEGEIGKMIFSYNHGHNWTEFFFEDYKLEGAVRPQFLTTVPDSTGLKFVLVATTGGESNIKHWIYSIDYTEVGLPKCTDDDFETWYARKDSEGKPTCIMGHTQSFRRRKANARCFVGEEFRDPMPQNDPSNCVCQEKDWECNTGYVRSEDRKECVPLHPIKTDDQCKTAEDEFEAPSGFRLIPGNDCKLDDSLDKGKPIRRKCSEGIQKPTGDVSHEIFRFPEAKWREYYYLERAGSSSGDDETVVMLTNERTIWISKDHGKTWEQKLKDVQVVAIYPNRYFNDNVYFITSTSAVYYSKDRGNHIAKFEAPGKPVTSIDTPIQILKFHQTEPDWLIWTTCAESSNPCQAQAHASTHHGDGDWRVLMRSIENCEFVYREGRPTDKKLIYCTYFPNEDPHGTKVLDGSEDFFENKHRYFNDVLNYATMSEYIIVAAKDGEDSQNLKVDASIDGKNFADAKFPPNLQVPHQTAYTVLDSSTHAIFLHVTVNPDVYPDQDSAYGSIIKSNSNGTSYVLSLNGVNRNSYGYVDFEKMMTLEGVAVANVVSNTDEVRQGSAPKKIRTMITHNDGADWTLIAPPAEDAEGRKYDCIGKSIDDCSLHLHGYTEREDPRDTYSSASAVGLMMGIGNVGPALTRKSEGHTFVTRDGGINWHTAKNGQYMWEFGDQGAIIVIVERMNPTKVVFYSRDEGKTWREYQFSSTAIQIEDITTVPSDTSRNFLLWGTESNRIVTVNLDFSGLTDQRCKLPDSDDSKSDYDLWEPKHPLQEDNCLFGHVAQYLRKKPDSNCYNGAYIDKLYKIKENCSCTAHDYECDYNYERQSDNTCALVIGHQPKVAEDQCKENPGLKEYHEVTGYRKVPLSTCSGGIQLEGKTFPCKGYEEEYRQKHGISGVGLFFAITIPIIVAVGAGYWVYRHMEGRFGRIRLGDGIPGRGGFSSTSGGQSPWIRYPVAVVAGIAAVALATPRVVGGVVRAVRERFGRRGGGRYGGSGLGGLSGVGRGQTPYRTRGSFRRGRGDYAAVGTGDEGELLGDESDDEV